MQLCVTMKKTSLTGGARLGIKRVTLQKLSKSAGAWPCPTGAFLCYGSYHAGCSGSCNSCGGGQGAGCYTEGQEC